MGAWDAARAAQHRTLRKPYKPVKPVGQKLFHSDGIHSLSERSDGTCGRCGYHVCSCPAYVAPPYGHTLEGVEIRLWPYIKPGSDVAWFVNLDMPTPHILCGLLTQKQLDVLRTVKKPAVQPRQTTERGPFMWPLLTPEQRARLGME